MRTAVVLAGLVLSVASAHHASAQSRPPERFGLGEPAPPSMIEALDTDVRPDGKGLPAGTGTAKEGAAVYATHCAACHGAGGEGGSADVLVGSEPRNMPPFGPRYEEWRAGRPDVPFTVGNYWPYATTLFDYVRRAMPLTAPGTLTAGEVYAVVAWILARNGIIAETDVMNAETLPRVMMPAHGRFVPDNRRGRPEVR